MKEIINAEASQIIDRLNRDLASGAANLSNEEARFLVATYYRFQDERIRFDAQIREMEKSDTPQTVLSWFADRTSSIEHQIKRALEKYVRNHPIGEWIISLYGFGPVLSAGLLAHIDIKKAPTVGHIWSYAGLLPGVVWEKGQKRPWNAELKNLCWKIGQSLLMFWNVEECYYGGLVRQRLDYEWARNLSGDNFQKVQAELTGKNFDKTTEAYAWLSGCYKAEDIRKFVEANQSLAAANLVKFKGEVGSGTPMLPPAQLLSRSARYAVKIFLSHLQTVWYEHEFKCRAPRPFLIEHGGHAHEIKVPNYESPYSGQTPAMPFKVSRDMNVPPLNRVPVPTRKSKSSSVSL